MALRKKEKTPEEIEARKAEISLNRQSRSFATKIKNNFGDIGLSVMREQLKFLKANPETKLPTQLTHKQTVAAFEQGITAYVDSLQLPAVQ